MTISMLIGYDLDGVLCDKPPKRGKPYSRQKKAEREAYAAELLRHYTTAAVRFVPQGRFVIVSGRSARYRSEIEAWVRRNGLSHCEGIYLNPKTRTRRNMVEHKINICRQLDVGLFYEDDPAIARQIERAGIPVMLVKES